LKFILRIEFGYLHLGFIKNKRLFQPIIFHITTPKVWQQFANETFFEAASLKTEGFIHTSTKAQLEATAQRYYAVEKEILILHLDACAMVSKIKYEWANSVQDYFPHIFGVIEKANILQIDTVKNQNGKFNIIDKMKRQP
jgi:uncharacterized protein (DUF952 family)